LENIFSITNKTGVITVCRGGLRMVYRANKLRDVKKYYEILFQGNRNKLWNDVPGKKVILQAFLDLIPNKENSILDLGCGDGYFLNQLKQQCPKRGNFKQHYYGMDISECAILKAQLEYKDINFVSMDAMSLGFKNECFDMVISYGAIEHIPDSQKALFEIRRVLKKEGMFLLMIPSLDYYRKDRQDEGWYEDLDQNKQKQWNYFRQTWEKMFLKSKLKLLDFDISKKYGAIKPGVFFFGYKHD